RGGLGVYQIRAAAGAAGPPQRFAGVSAGYHLRGSAPDLFGVRPGQSEHLDLVRDVQHHRAGSNVAGRVAGRGDGPAGRGVAGAGAARDLASAVYQRFGDSAVGDRARTPGAPALTNNIEAEGSGAGARPSASRKGPVPVAQVTGDAARALHRRVARARGLLGREAGGGGGDAGGRDRVAAVLEDGGSAAGDADLALFVVDGKEEGEIGIRCIGAPV